MASRPFASTAFLALIGRAGGFVIPFIIAAIYGATPATDAFFFSYGLVFLLITIFTHIFESALIPYLAQQKQEGALVSSLTNKILLRIFPIALVVFIGGQIFLKPWLLHFSGWSEPNAGLVAQFFLQMMPFFLASILISAAHSILFTYRIFWLSAFSPFIRSLIVIGVILVFHDTWNVHAVIWGFVWGEILRGLVTFFILKRKTPWRPTLAAISQTKESKPFFQQAFLQGAALIAVNSLFIADQWFASRLGEGMLSLLNYADRVLQIPYILLMSAFLQIFLTDWSDSYHSESAYHFWPKVHRDIHSVFLIGLGIGIVLWAVRYPIIQTIYGRGNFTEQELKVMSDVFGWLSVGFIPGVVRLLCGRVLFVMRKSALYCFLSWMEFTANIFLNILLIRSYGIVGISMATAMVYTVSTLSIYLYIRFRLRVQVAS